MVLGTGHLGSQAQEVEVLFQSKSIAEVREVRAWGPDHPWLKGQYKALGRAAAERSAEAGTGGG